MNLKNHFKKYGLTYWASFLVGGMYVVPISAQIYREIHTKDIGKEYSVTEMGNKRIFSFGNRRFGQDDNKDGTLDKVLINMPVSAFMGGPGWRPWIVPITEEDQRMFNQADSLLKSER